MKRYLVLFLIVLLAVPAFAALRTYYTSGTATEVSSTVTYSFNPSAFCIKNTGATNELFFVIGTDAVADTTDSANIQILAGGEKCINTNDPNVSNAFTIGIICSAGETTTYETWGIHR